ncbi:MAG: hypothetical protein RLW62_10570, partial [Gammaproteobacteria bacterium]
AWRGERGIDEVVRVAVALVLGAVLAQALALAAAVVSVHRARRQRAPLSTTLVLLLLALVLPDIFGLAVPAGLTPPPDTLAWYGWRIAPAPFGLALLALLAAWAVLGAYRAMCIELDIRTTPWAWLAFVLFLALVVTGLAPQPAPALALAVCSAAALYAALLAYVAGFAFARDPLQVRRVLQALADGQPRRALEELPLALSSLVIAFTFAVVATLLGADPALSNERPDNLGAVALALTLMALRDLALLAAVSFGDATRRAEIVTIVIIALLNRVLPAALGFVGLAGVAGLLRPALLDAPRAACAILAVQAVIALALAALAWRRAMALNPPGDRRS